MNEPHPDGLPRLPVDLGEAAKLVWTEVMNSLGATGVITGADGPTLRIYCEAVARYQEAASLLSQSGLLLRDGKSVRRNPLHQIMRDNADQVRLFARELGLTPASRSAVSVAIGGTGQWPQARSKIDELAERAARRRAGRRGS